MGAPIVDDPCVEIQDQIQQAKAFSIRLAELMERAAEDLRTTGLSPSPELISALQNYRQMFRDLRTRLSDEIGGAPATEPLRTPASLADLERHFEGQVATRRALSFLDQLQHLSHLDGEQHPVLDVCRRACQATLEAVREQDANSRNIVRTINEGDHPLSALWNLLNHQETLNDNDWAELLERVTDHFGRDVATAVARHKLLIPSIDASAETEMLIGQNS